MRPLFTLFILSVVVAGCGNPSQNGSPSSAPQIVNVVTVESRKLDTTLSLPAQVTPYEVVDIYPKVTGFLDIINVDRGSAVHAGEVIVRLSAPELVAQRAQADAALQSAEAQLTAAQAKFASDHGTYL